MSFIWNLISFIVAIGLLVTIHEYGHYWVAKRCKVKVLKFSIGFGKALYSWKNKANTEFVIAAIPLGGFVRMLDSRLDEVEADEQHLAFNHKPVLQRIAIVAAGPLSNLIFAAIAIWLMLLIGQTVYKPIIDDVTPNSIAHQASFSSGDEIVTIGGKQTQTWQQVNFELMRAINTDKLEIKVKPDNQSYLVTHILDLTNWQVSDKNPDLLKSLGILPYRSEVLGVISRVQSGSPADKAGLQVNDEIISFNQQDYNWQALATWIAEHPNQTINLTLLREQKIVELSVTTGVRETKQKEVGFLGVVPTVKPAEGKYTRLVQYGLFDGFINAINQTWRMIELSFAMLGKLIMGDISVKSLSGPISIAEGAGASASLGVVYFLSFLALISINLGIINILPLPILDGGHLLYYLIELVTGRPVSEPVQEVGFKIGAFIIFTMMTIAIFNDLSLW
ncbi:sigma E protease regulator RseP [Catenovulum maritimum]|uniref:Zinc metalloprotease n=1 Tax=Catenovulum maritimum TaxID=1513271 RepID=A0A0J8JLK0_9ALTE|nr:sigma E protease regulator RseP [Catenovulum maritimum]KMT65441.1 zinc metallopeptidase RseP [Catenovulum maritimum]